MQKSQKRAHEQPEPKCGHISSAMLSATSRGLNTDSSDRRMQKERRKLELFTRNPRDAIYKKKWRCGSCTRLFKISTAKKDERLSRSIDPLRMLFVANKKEIGEKIKPRGEHEKTLKRVNCLMQFDHLPVGWRMPWISRSRRKQTTK